MYLKEKDVVEYVMALPVVVVVVDVVVEVVEVVGEMCVVWTGLFGASLRLSL